MLESQLDDVDQRIYDSRVRVAAASLDVKQWLGGKQASFTAGRPGRRESRNWFALATTWGGTRAGACQQSARSWSREAQAKRI